MFLNILVKDLFPHLELIIFVENVEAMSDSERIQLFENKKVRTAWDEEKQEWFFSMVDSIEILAESNDPKQYIKKMRARDSELSAKWGTICTPPYDNDRRRASKDALCQFGGDVPVLVLVSGWLRDALRLDPKFSKRIAWKKFTKPMA